MPIVCPHCATSYAIDPSSLGPSGRTVRCARCKETWLARAEDAHVAAPVHAAAMEAAAPAASGHEPAAHDVDWDDTPAPEIDSPSIAADLPLDDADGPAASADPEGIPVATFGRRAPDRRRWLRKPDVSRLWQRRPASRRSGWFNVSTAALAMASLAAALVVWRADVVRAMPQTADFYAAIGFGVNLRGLAIKDVKVVSEVVEGKPVLVIEGVILDIAGKAVELPRLRFAVRDARGTEIYAWNAVLEQTVLQPGEKAWFRSRLAAPPAEARSIDVRFFNRRDLAAGRA